MKKLEEIKQKISCSDAIKRYNIRKIAIFGSYANGTQHEKSDIDILVEFNDPIGLISFMKLKFEFENLLKSKIDLVTRKALKPNSGKNIMKSAVYIL